MCVCELYENNNIYLKQDMLNNSEVEKKAQ